MNDTSAPMSAKMRELILRKQPEERLRMGCSMYGFSKQLVTDAILREHPGLSLKVLRGELFRRFYGSDFAPRQQKKILEHLTRHETGAHETGAGSWRDRYWAKNRSAEMKEKKGSI